MKKIILLLPIFLLLFSCIENESVINKLKIKDVSKLIKQDSLYEEIIYEIDSHKSNFEDNIILMSKFKELSYSDYLDYKKKSSDEYLINKVYSEADSLAQINLNEELNIYKPKIDSSITEYRNIRDKNDPTKYFKAEFSSIEKEYYSYGNDVMMQISFNITPLNGPIHGGGFLYKVISKETNKEVAEGGGRLNTYTFTDEIFTWEAPYDVKDEFENTSTEYIKENYDFEFTYVTVKIKDKTISAIDMFLIIPLIYQVYLDKDSLNMWEYKSIMESEFDISVKSSSEIMGELLRKEKKKINPLAFKFESILSGYTHSTY